jgi:3-hydroxymyristoyl/3-hydroxydecanoyl-(acyl carrier protein) dehydratase
MRFLFVDRIIQSTPGEVIRGVKHVTPDDACLTVDEQGRPCFMSSLIGETLGQLAAWNVMAHYDFTVRPVAGVVSSARLCRPAYLGDTLLLESFIDVLDETAVQYHSIARVGDEPVFIIDGALGPLLPMEQFIDRDEVEHQYHEIYRPGDWELISQTLQSASEIDVIESHTVARATLTFDRILACLPGEYITAEKKVTRAAPYFPDHFPKKPVLPMTVLLECTQNLARQFITKSAAWNGYQISELRKIKMNEFVQPGDVVVCHMKVKQQSQDELVLASRCDVDGKRVCVVDVVLNAKR